MDCDTATILFLGEACGTDGDSCAALYFRFALACLSSGGFEELDCVGLSWTEDTFLVGDLVRVDGAARLDAAVAVGASPCRSA